MTSYSSLCELLPRFQISFEYLKNPQKVFHSIAGQTAERKISFVLHEPDNESEGSSNTTLTLQGEDSAGCKHFKNMEYQPFHNFVLLQMAIKGDQ